MSKYLSRIGKETQKYVIQIIDFELFAPVDREYLNVHLELQRGTYKKNISPGNKNPENQSESNLQEIGKLSSKQQRIFFNEPYQHISKFYLDKNESGQTKMLKI